MAFIPDARVVPAKSRFIPDAQPPADPAVRAKAEAELRAAEAAPTPTAFGIPAGGALDAVRTGVRGGGQFATNLAKGAIALPRLIEQGIGIPGALLTGKPLSGPVQDLTQFLSPEELAPQNRAEDVAATLTQGLGGVIGGGGLGNVLTKVAAPFSGAAGTGAALSSGLGAQLTGALTGGGAAEVAKSAGGGEIAQNLAGMAGGFAPGVAAARTPKNYVENAPIALTTRQLKGNTDSQYQQARDSGLVYRGDSVGKFRDSVLGDEGYSSPAFATQAPKTSDVLKVLGQYGGDTKLSHLEDLRKLAGDVLDPKNSATDTDAGYARALKQKIDSFIHGAAPEDLAAGDAAGLGNLRKGREYHRRTKSSEAIEKVGADAELAADGDKGRATRAGLRNLAKSKAAGRFSEQDQQAIRDQAEGGLGDRLLSGAGNMAPDGGVARTVLGLASLGAIPVSGGSSMLAIPAGIAAKALSGRRATGKLEALRQQVSKARPIKEPAPVDPQAAIDDAIGEAAPQQKPFLSPADGLLPETVAQPAIDEALGSRPFTAEDLFPADEHLDIDELLRSLEEPAAARSLQADNAHRLSGDLQTANPEVDGLVDLDPRLAAAIQGTAPNRSTQVPASARQVQGELEPDARTLKTLAKLEALRARKIDPVNLGEEFAPQ